MSNQGQCFRCSKTIEKGKRLELWGSKVGAPLVRVRVHEQCNTSMAGKTVYFLGPGHEERRVYGSLTEAAVKERKRLGR